MIKSLKIANTLWVNKDNFLFLPFINPQNKVGIETTGLKETYAFATLIAQQIDFFSFKLSVLVLFVKVTNASDKARFSNI